jgi:hypothetical protein
LIIVKPSGIVDFEMGILHGIDRFFDGQMVKIEKTMGILDDASQRPDPAEQATKSIPCAYCGQPLNDKGLCDEGCGAPQK